MNDQKTNLCLLLYNIFGPTVFLTKFWLLMTLYKCLTTILFNAWLSSQLPPINTVSINHLSCWLNFNSAISLEYLQFLDILFFIMQWYTTSNKVGTHENGRRTSPAIVIAMGRLDNRSSQQSVGMERWELHRLAGGLSCCRSSTRYF